MAWTLHGIDQTAGITTDIKSGAITSRWPGNTLDAEIMANIVGLVADFHGAGKSVANSGYGSATAKVLGGKHLTLTYRRRQIRMRRFHG
ncbi:hypothethical protein [Ralstonia solanacearum PSI07]|nr:hypothethical protein [Ralstonia solanacearum PSI07]